MSEPDKVFFLACEHRDETRRWLLEIGDLLHVEPTDSDGVEPPQRAWRRYKNQLVKEICKLRNQVRNKH